ncbi:nucleotidyltransferase family protein [Umezawaea beigongshangensis]|uniref:nucleotidyltransferase family protein n=1 Tax=Umezawaea beigongshangensis TaxID=2780383 RepID=UPI0018F1FB90|nr:nucleotidyltransferase family protein [Umezawaea beigongshangensis]
MSGIQDELLRTLTKVAKALRTAGIPFALTGGCAGYARGGPPSEHDVDLLVREEDTEAAVSALVAAGMRSAEPPEDWLLKVYDGDYLVDLLFRPNEQQVTDEVLACAEELQVGSVTLPVMPATEVLISKLGVLSDHRCDFSELLPFARALREQIDWDRVRVETADSPFAEAFLVLSERLAIVEPRREPVDSVR